MEELIERVRAALERAFPGATVSLEQAIPLEKVGGVLLWDDFETMEQIERQQLLAKKLRESLSGSDLLRVTAILTLTSAEVSTPTEN